MNGSENSKPIYNNYYRVISHQMRMCIYIVRLLPLILLVGCGNPGPVEPPSEATSSNEVSEEKMNSAPAEKPLTPVQQIARAISSGDLPLVKRLLAEHPELMHFKSTYMGTWVSMAAINCQKHIAEWLLDQGLDINYSTQDCPSPLSKAFTCLEDEGTAVEMIQFLLSRGADPNTGRVSIGALNCKDSELRLRLLKMFVEHGLDVNQVFDVFGDKDKPFTALDWADGECAEYLRTVGAKTAKELKAAAETPAKPN